MFKGEKITAYLAAIAAAKDIQYAVVSPGSRSAPLTLAFAREQAITCLPVIDERSAGYIALGIAQQTELPVVLICTSGTAAVNFGPAIAEAYYQKIPLIVLTADRPAEWIGQLDGQAVDQRNLFGNFCIQSFSISGEAWHEDDLWYAQRCMNEAVDTSVESSGPVHINISFREPLYDIPPVDPKYLKIVRSTVSDIYPVNSEPIMAAARLAAGYERILLVIGQMNWDDELEHLLEKFDEFSNVVVIKESLANLEIAGAVLNPGECVYSASDEHVPELVISMGGSLVSKKLKQWIRSHKVEHWHVSTDDQYIDTFKSLARHIKCNYYTFVFSLSVALKKSAVQSDFGFNWRNLSARRQEEVAGYSASAPYSDWKVYDYIFRNLPEQIVLHLANSTPVRYGQIFSHLQPHVLTYANRGTSGIDGCLSTAVGAAVVADQTVLAVMGDLAFQYDSNALWNKHVSSQLKIVIVNNSGGNIFRLIEGSSTVPELEKYFETRISHSFEHLARHFGVRYFRADSMDSLTEVWDSFMKKREKATILEIVTDPLESQAVFQRFYKK